MRSCSSWVQEQMRGPGRRSKQILSTGNGKNESDGAFSSGSHEGGASSSGSSYLGLGDPSYRTGFVELSLINRRLGH